jgi:predicted enzyme related to lactoylglutathione lyase
VSEGVVAGINYVNSMRDGKAPANIFRKGQDNPLAARVTTLTVESIAAYEENIQALGGQVLIPAHTCPGTGTPFAVCVDPTGHQVMITEARRP